MNFSRLIPWDLLEYLQNTFELDLTVGAALLIVSYRYKDSQLLR